MLSSPNPISQGCMSMPELLGARPELAPPLWALVRDATETWGKERRTGKTRDSSGSWAEAGHGLEPVSVVSATHPFR